MVIKKKIETSTFKRSNGLKLISGTLIVPWQTQMQTILDIQSFSHGELILWDNSAMVEILLTHAQSLSQRASALKFTSPKLPVDTLTVCSFQETDISLPSEVTLMANLESTTLK